MRSVPIPQKPNALAVTVVVVTMVVRVWYVGPRDLLEAFTRHPPAHLCVFRDFASASHVRGVTLFATPPAAHPSVLCSSRIFSCRLRVMNSYGDDM